MVGRIPYYVPCSLYLAGDATSRSIHGDCVVYSVRGKML